MAYYELGRAMWKKGDTARALLCLEETFKKATSKSLFLHAGCSLDILLDKYPELADRSPGLLTQLKTCSRLWSCRLMPECKIEPGRSSSSLTGKPGEWLVSFYRSQIGPALGRRCSLHPSCSEYARQAFRKHGLLGVALIGDRSIREPGVVAEKKSPIRVGGHDFYQDPLEEHDWWMAPAARPLGRSVGTAPRNMWGERRACHAFGVAVCGRPRSMRGKASACHAKGVGSTLLEGRETYATAMAKTIATFNSKLG